MPPDADKIEDKVIEEVTEEIEKEPKEGQEEEVKEEKLEPRTYTQEDLDRITAKVKKNARYQARKETEAYYKGRDSRPEKHAESNEDTPPERTSFDSYEDFLDAKAEYAGRKSAKEERIKSEQEAESNKIDEGRQKVFNDFQTKVREKYPDIEDRIEIISDIAMPDSVLQAIAESDVGPDILSYFSDNPKECERLAALTPSKAIRELGRLEVKLEVKSETKEHKPEKTVSKAPVPIKPGGGGSPPDGTAKDTDPIEVWIEKEQARSRKKLGL
jgi:hypothetical protein